MVAISLMRSDRTLVGTVGPQRVDLLLDLPRSSAGVRGYCLDAEVGCYWRIESNSDNLDPVGLLLGEYNGEPVYLRSEVHLTPYYTVRHADITGTVGQQEVRVRAAPVEAPAYGPNVMGIDGHFDGATITLFVAVMGDLSGASISGVIDGNTVRIDATPTDRDRPAQTSVTGEYDGPAALFPLFVCSLLFFI